MSNRIEPLSLDGDWERIVNDVERHNARVRFEENRQRRRILKQLTNILNCILVACAAIALDFASLLASLIALPLAVVFLCIACFMAGQVWEQRTR